MTFFETAPTGDVAALMDALATRIEGMKTSEAFEIIESCRRTGLDYPALLKIAIQRLSALTPQQYVQVLGLSLFRGTIQKTWIRNMTSEKAQQVRDLWTLMDFKTGTIQSNHLTPTRLMRVTGPMVGLIILKTAPTVIDATNQLLEYTGFPGAIPSVFRGQDLVLIMGAWVATQQVRMKKVKPIIPDVGSEQWTTGIATTAKSLHELDFTEALYRPFWSNSVSKLGQDSFLDANREGQWFIPNGARAHLLASCVALTPQQKLLIGTVFDANFPVN